MSWVRAGNHIAIKEASRVAHLEAIDVYNAIENAEYEYMGQQQGSLISFFNDLWFSPISKNAQVVLSSDADSLVLSVEVDNVTVDSINGQFLDQVIVGKEWHFISNAEEINSVMAKAGIKDNGPITMSHYLLILRTLIDSDFLQNNVDPSFLKANLMYNRPTGLNADLYPYQKVGYAWLEYMLNANHGCVLGDEMGLGKTLQAIALIQQRSNRNEKTLVIAPVSLLENWYKECSKFAPSLKLLIHHGPKRSGSPKAFNNYDVVITSFGNVVTDNLLISMRKWDFVVLDEAQGIKNPSSTRAKAVKGIPATNRLAMTGTPFENHVKDIWSIVDFVLPGFLWTERQFDSMIADNQDGAAKLEPILSSIMIRRLVSEVAQDLPERIDIPQPVPMTEEEADDYETVRRQLVDDNSITISSLQKLRMYCTHPAVYNETNTADPILQSLKYRRCCEILEEIFARDEKALIFTSFQKMFDIFMTDIPKRFGIPVDCINGTTPVKERQKKVDRFNSLGGKAVMVLNPHAAGTGLNITGANHVIHYNLEWNPAVEDQASARAYRRGQNKTTFIYRLYYMGTVEESINDRIEFKRKMAETAVIGSDGSQADIQYIIDAMKKTPKGVII